MSEGKDRCEVCGETEFEVKDGFYYCSECGTQSHHIDIEVDQTANEESKVFFTTVRLDKEKETEKGQLTTWECFNYLLRGLVDELLTLGAKEQLKLTVLQLWTTYLKKMEVAFFNKKHAELPRLGPKYNERDARLLYNHKRQKQKKSRKSTEDKNETWSKQKKLYAKAEYDALSASDRSTLPSTSVRTSQSSGASDRPIQLIFSRKARQYYKRYLPARHLKRHELDGTYELKCHALCANKFKGGTVKSEMLLRKTIYALLYLALNLIEDDLQLCDLIRFCREGHISTSNIGHFFPDEIARDCVGLINQRNYFGWTLFRSIAIREEAAKVANFTHINGLKLPNFIKLTKRFVSELYLPDDVGLFVERLFNFHRPQMKFNLGDATTPCYEGRAMAYVIFVLKLLFILDDESDLLISNTAEALNKHLTSLGLEDKQIFVWKNWVQYIEMRRIILSMYHYPSSLNFGENLNNDQYIEHLKGTYKNPYGDHLESEPSKMERIFKNLHEKLKQKSQANVEIGSRKFSPSFTPSSSYLKNILSESNFVDRITLPELMHIDYTAHDIRSFLSAQELKEILKKNNTKLLVNKIGPILQRNNVGIFKAIKYNDRTREAKRVRVRTVEHDINESVWLENLKLKNQTRNIFTEIGEFKFPALPVRLINQRKSTNSTSIISDTQSVCSFDIFTEENMEPLSEMDIRPRQFDTESVLTDLSDSDENDTESPETDTNQQTVELKVSRFDCWSLTGLTKNLSTDEIRLVIHKLPKIFQWLLKIGSEIAEIDTIVLYQELLTIENEFLYAAEPLDSFRDVLTYRERVSNREIQQSIRHYKKMW